MVALLWSTDRYGDQILVKQTVYLQHSLNMDKGLKHEKFSKVLKTEQERHHSPRQAVVSGQWDSLESDTESLAQERAYQQQLQMRIGCHYQNEYILPQKEDANSLQKGDGEDEDANDDETEDLHVYDSLDVSAQPHAEKNPTLLQAEYLDTHMDEREETSQLLTDDAYSGLRYDPNWRTNLRGAAHFNESPCISVEGYCQEPKKNSSQSRGDRQRLVIKGGYRYIVDTSPAVMMTPHMAGNESDKPYCLHPQDCQTSSKASPSCHSHALRLRSPEADHSKPSCIFTRNESDKSLLKGFRKKSKNNSDNARFPELTKDMHAMYIEDFQTYYLQEQRCTQGRPTQMQKMSTSTFPKVLLNKKLERPNEDIVERNKKTLGCNTSKCGSYVSVHALKQEMPPDVHKEMASDESQEDSSDSKLKRKKFKVSQISEGKKAQSEEHPNCLQQQKQPSALGVKLEWGDCLSSPLAVPAAVTQPGSQKTSSQPMLSAINLNINLNPLSHLLPLIRERSPYGIINLTSLHGCPQWSPASEVDLALSPECQQTNPGKCSQRSLQGVNANLHQRNLEGSHKQRANAIKWPLSCEGEDQQCPNEVPTNTFSQNLPRTPITTSPLGSGTSTVLPPIRKSMTGEKLELSSGVNTAYSSDRSSSDGYLVQMEKQKRWRARVMHKESSLRDTKKLKRNIQGLGPDNTAIEKTAEKMNSNVIHKQKINISRIPFLLAKDPEGNGKKVPRIKALEYAKTIAKPLVQSQPKQRQKHQSEGLTEHASYLGGADVSMLTSLEILKKRHEEEKHAVALLRKVRAV